MKLKERLMRAGNAILHGNVSLDTHRKNESEATMYIQTSELGEFYEYMRLHPYMDLHECVHAFDERKRVLAA